MFIRSNSDPHYVMFLNMQIQISFLFFFISSIFYSNNIVGYNSDPAVDFILKLAVLDLLLLYSQLMYS